MSAPESVPALINLFDNADILSVISSLLPLKLAVRLSLLCKGIPLHAVLSRLTSLRDLTEEAVLRFALENAARLTRISSIYLDYIQSDSGQSASVQIFRAFGPWCTVVDGGLFPSVFVPHDESISSYISPSKIVAVYLEGTDFERIDQNFDQLERLQICSAYLSSLPSAFDCAIRHMRHLRYVGVFLTSYWFAPSEFRIFASLKKLLDSVPTIQLIDLQLFETATSAFLADARGVLDPSCPSDNFNPVLLLEHSHILKRILVNGWNLWEVFYLVHNDISQLSDIKLCADSFNLYRSFSDVDFVGLAQYATILAESQVLSHSNSRDAILWVISSLEELFLQEERFGLGNPHLLLAAIAAYGLALASNHPDPSRLLRWCRASLAALPSPDLFDILQPIFALPYDYRRPVVVDIAVELGIENFAPLAPKDDRGNATLLVLIGLLHNPKFAPTDPRLLQTAFQQFFVYSEFSSAFTHAGDDL
eukprot:TRINITY_DN2095_c0_g1_i1.p1 TRINITY_DN2095_c0_g1~~TRINITY_DN2095_c0_g1_i1.p1  ORF type:complete len:478 (-),score=22.87 TRINITY_DN2095_c0_g1_i1:215-1648(-)